jgi:hypothetical protein
LANDADLGVGDVAGGIAIQCAFDAGAGQALNAVSITRATCYVALELPYPLSPPERTMWNMTSGALGFERLVLDGQVTVSTQSIVWQPTSATATWLRSALFGLVTSTTGIDRLLARLTLKGNFISSLATATTPASSLDGEVFGSSGRDRTAMVLPSGDGHRGGDFDMWFWLVQNAGLANVAITQGTVVGGATVRVTITLTGPAPAAGTTIQVFVDGDATGTVKAPASVTVPSGGNSAAFDVTTQPVTSAVNASIRVVLTTGTRSESRAVNLTVQPPVVDTLTLNPPALDSGSLSQATLALTGQAPTGGLSVRLVSSDPNAAAFPDVPSGTVVVPAGQNSLAVRVSTNPAIGNVTVTISATPAAPDKPAQSNLTIRRLTVTGPTFAPAEVMGGIASVGTLTLSGVAPAGGSTIDLAPPPRLTLTDASGTAVSSLVVGAGNRTATFNAIPEGALARTALPVNATLRVGGATTSGTLFVSASAVASVGLASNNVTGGAVVNGQVTLSGPAPREGAVVNLGCNPGVVSFRNPAGALVGSIVVPANTNNAAFAVATQVLGQGSVQTVTIFASISGQAAATTVLTVRGPTKSTTKDNKDNKDDKDSSDGGGGKLIHEQLVPNLSPGITPRMMNPGVIEPVDPIGQAFIQPAERPDVGAATVEEATAAPPEPTPPPEPEPPARKPRRARRPRQQSG